MSVSEAQKRQQLIMARYLAPLHRNGVTGVQHYQKCASSTCADWVEVGFNVVNAHLSNVSFSGQGCAVFTSATDLVVEALENLSLTAAKELLTNFESLVRTGQSPVQFEDLNVFANVGQHFNRLNCALLSVKTLQELLARLI